MCTAITLTDNLNNYYLGRTMDFSYDINPKIYTSLRNSVFKNSVSNQIIKNKYSFIGMGQKFEVSSNISQTIYVDGVNENGFGVAVLYFPGFAVYDDIKKCDYGLKIDSINIVNYLLGNCRDVNDACCELKKISIIGVKDFVTKSIAPLHWIIADKYGNCKVVEKMKDGLHIIDNNIGVLANSPNFEWHMENLRNYLELKTIQNLKSNWGEVSLTPFGNGSGSIGLPGDFSPPSRFVRAAFLKTHMEKIKNMEECKQAFFHIMESVSVPKGCVITNNGQIDYTRYTSFMDLNKGIYYYRTYENSEIVSYELVL